MTEHDQTMALLLEQARADLTAARQRVAELEDWQRRAAPVMADAPDCGCPVVSGCEWCRTRDELLSEVKP